MILLMVPRRIIPRQGISPVSEKHNRRPTTSHPKTKTGNLFEPASFWSYLRYLERGLSPDPTWTGVDSVYIFSLWG